jgi:hypothetical protein
LIFGYLGQLLCVLFNFCFFSPCNLSKIVFLLAIFLLITGLAIALVFLLSFLLLEAVAQCNFQRCLELLNKGKHLY